jgi:hypothetical protein
MLRRRSLETRLSSTSPVSCRVLDPREESTADTHSHRQ